MGLGHAFEIDPALEDTLLLEFAMAMMVRERFPKSPITRRLNRPAPSTAEDRAWKAVSQRWAAHGGARAAGPVLLHPAARPRIHGLL